MTKSVKDVFKELAEAHFKIEEKLQRVGLFSPEGDDEVKLIEVNEETLSTGSVMPFFFTASEDVPMGVRIADVTEEEWKALLKGEIPLPEGWSKKPQAVIERPDERPVDG